jgi:hypothetical protein
MKTFNFDYNVGLVVSSIQTLTLLTDLEALVSKIYQRLRFLKGEWFLNTTLGIAYRSQLAKPPINPALIANIIREEVGKESDVTDVKDLSIEFNSLTRAFSYEFSVDTIYGSSFLVGTVN